MFSMSSTYIALHTAYIFKLLSSQFQNTVEKNSEKKQKKVMEIAKCVSFHTIPAVEIDLIHSRVHFSLLNYIHIHTCTDLTLLVMQI